MNYQQASQRFSRLSKEAQLRVLARFGHNLTIAARDTYEFQAPGVLAPERLRTINEIQHRILGHLLALFTDGLRYPDDTLLSIMLDHDDEHLHEQALWAFRDALEHFAAD